MAALCRCCGQTRCPTYQPMDFTRFEDQIAGEDGMGCHCDICNPLKYEASRPMGRTLPFTQALWDALVAGTHVHVSWDEWAEKLRANSTGGRGYQSSGSVMMNGIGAGVTPGGVTGSGYRRERAARPRPEGDVTA